MLMMFLLLFPKLLKLFHTAGSDGDNIAIAKNW
jgi:hypothetical protein